jgi:hypothetical protein
MSHSSAPLSADVAVEKTFRVPAVPIVTHTPYFSVWSPADRLTDDWCQHWTEANHPIFGMLRIDGKAYRFAGKQQFGEPAMEQLSVEIHATRTEYRFQAAGVQLTVEFLSPLLPDDIELLARPVTYVTLTARSVDHQAHEVVAYLDVSAEWCVHGTCEKVFPSRHRIEGLETLAVRSADQPVLKRPGDHVRIDWGTLLLSTASHSSVESAIGSQYTVRKGFLEEGALPFGDDMRFPRSANDEWPVLALSMPMGLVGADESSRMAMLAYDEEFAIEYLHRKLPPYWRRNGLQADALLTLARNDYPEVRRRCREFDAKLWQDLSARGGEDYARIATRAYRQCIAAHGIVEDVDGTLMMFSKENDSNGCIGTVDVTYPGSPLFLYLNPALLKAQVEPVLRYAASSRWRFPFAPHDLGTYPLANGQVYGGGERDEHDQMPVEECGNMLILVAAICLQEGSASFAEPYWKQLGQWADYLINCGLDPENQLCTDDFAGHMAHNANLAIKAIVALGAFAELCSLMCLAHERNRVREQAEKMARQWLKMADDGDHTKLAFDQPGTWSQKYNLVWDRILGLNLFPQELAQREVAYYLTRLNEFGLPLDSRKDYTKLDWCVWTATMASDRADFEAIVEPLVRFCNATPDRVALTDWYDTKTAEQEHFQARSVVGGVYLPMLRPVTARV